MAKSIKMGNCYPPSQDEEDYYEEYDSEEYEDNEEVKEELLGQKAKAKSIIVKVKKVQSGVNDELSMKIDIDVELSWLMMRYRDKLGMHKSDYKFMFNGVHVRQTDTPRGLSMRDNDIIYVFPTSMHRGYFLSLISLLFLDFVMFFCYCYCVNVCQETILNKNLR
ncbi:hypothetical protein RND81_06G215700 [Saponaria officinalis]|uniref:Ubiquitin-like domain-containing protein n=1 Tax=Saponaria officinalis TaxID=3572 RepID=A0AAW1KDY7_SAPOF